MTKDRLIAFAQAAARNDTRFDRTQSPAELAVSFVGYVKCLARFLLTRSAIRAETALAAIEAYRQVRNTPSNDRNNATPQAGTLRSLLSQFALRRTSRSRDEDAA